MFASILYSVRRPVPVAAHPRRAVVAQGLLGTLLGLLLLAPFGHAADQTPAATPPTTAAGDKPADKPGDKPAAEPASNNLDPKTEEASVTDLRKKGADLIGKILASNPANRTVDLLIDGAAKLVELISLDKDRGLHFKQFGKKGIIPFDQLTITQIAGILTALTPEEFEDAPEAHLTAGLMFSVIGKNLESSNEIAKAVELDDRLQAVAQEQLKKLPKPPVIPNGPDLSGILNAYGGGSGGGGSASYLAPGGGNYPPVPVGPWKCMGFGGGGSIYTPVISPHDPKVGIVTSDMSGIYLTRDGGRHWQILPRMSNGRGIAFSPTDPNVIYVGTISMLYRTADLGLTWKTVTKDYQYPQCSVWECCVDPDDGNSVWVSMGRGTIEAGMSQMASTKLQIERSTDAGNTFVDASAGLATGAGIVRKMAVDRSSPVGNRTLYAVTSDGFYRSTNHGAQWAPFGGKGLPGKNMRDIVTLYDKAAKKTTILVIMETGGLFRSTDGGATFAPSGSGIGAQADGTGVVLNAIGASWVDANIVWAAGADTWKSTDAGRTWKSIYDDATKFAGAQMIKAPWRHAGGYGIGCAPKNPNIMWYTGVGHCIGTTDGGASLVELDSAPMPEGTPRFSFTGPDCWKICHTAPVHYDGGNLEVTNSYQVIPDPHNPKTWYACFADVGQWRTDDAGDSWVYGMGWWNDGIKSEWRNSVYEIAPDPRKPGKLYQVCTGKHDLPGKDIEGADTYDRGGVAISEDGGSIWRPLEKCGLPEKCMTSILLDNRSTGQNTLWVTIYTQGVWRSTDDGGTFVNVSKGLPSTIRAWRLRQASDGSILLITVNQKPGGIFRYDDKAGSWALLPATKSFPSVLDMITGPKGFLAIAVEASAAPSKGAESNGGIFASYDNGESWKKLLDGSFRGVDRTPDGQSWFAVGHRGLLRSLDGGVNWTADKDLPFTHLNDVTVNPRNPAELWLSSAGCGIFKGPASGIPGTVGPSTPPATPPATPTTPLMPGTSGISNPATATGSAAGQPVAQ